MGDPAAGLVRKLEGLLRQGAPLLCFYVICHIRYCIFHMAW